MAETSRPGRSARPRFDAHDAIGVVGLGLLAAGGWLAWQPLGLLLPGAVLTGLALVTARAG